MDGWVSVQELTRWAFAHSLVVMANEAHDGLARCIRTRQVGRRMIVAAHQSGVRRLAMEALPWPSRGRPGPIGSIPTSPGGYLAQPEMRELIGGALKLGWSLWAYEAEFDVGPDTDPAELMTLEFTNWREREQARNLCQLVTAAPAEPMLVWTGNGHASKHTDGQWIPMGHHFAAISGIDAFVIDQTVTVDWPGQARPWVSQLVSEIRPTLAACGGSAGILREHAPPPLDCWPGVDAVVISVDNKLS